VAIGDPNTAIGTGAVAIGADNIAAGGGAVALGNASSAVGQGSVAIGNTANAGTNGVAIGNGASTGVFANSVAIGAGSVNTADSQVEVGGRVVSGVANGIAPNDAVNVNQLNAAFGDISGLQSDFAALQGDVATLFDLRGQDRRDMKQGVASAMAMAQAPMPSRPGGIGYAVNGAAFRGEYAVGGSINYRLNTENPTALTVGFSYAGNKNSGVRVGVAGEF
jgi:autotransporter adhesin